MSMNVPGLRIIGSSSGTSGASAHGRSRSRERRRDEEELRGGYDRDGNHGGLVVEGHTMVIV
jgi:hypothetical protein